MTVYTFNNALEFFKGLFEGRISDLLAETGVEPDSGFELDSPQVLAAAIIGLTVTPHVQKGKGLKLESSARMILEKILEIYPWDTENSPLYEVAAIFFQVHQDLQPMIIRLYQELDIYDDRRESLAHLAEMIDLGLEAEEEINDENDEEEVGAEETPGNNETVQTGKKKEKSKRVPSKARGNNSEAPWGYKKDGTPKKKPGKRKNT